MFNVKRKINSTSPSLVLKHWCCACSKQSVSSILYLYHGGNPKHSLRTNLKVNQS